MPHLDAELGGDDEDVAQEATGSGGPLAATSSPQNQIWWVKTGASPPTSIHGLLGDGRPLEPPESAFEKN